MEERQPDITIVRSPIREVNDTFKVVLFGLSAVTGYALGATDASRLVNSFEQYGVPKQALLVGFGLLLVSELIFRRYGSLVEAAYTKKWHEENFVDIKKEIGLHLMKLAEVLLLGANTSFLITSFK